MIVLRVGIGYDVHAFSDDAARPLILGGVTVQEGRGLAGHSDADVLLHAICDALLGALALGDIGVHFPDTDPQYHNISSLILLKHCGALLEQKGWRVSNIDSVIMAEKPKLAPYIAEMRQNIAAVLDMSWAAVSVKATTTEHLGFVGRSEGIAAQAVELLTPVGL